MNNHKPEILEIDGTFKTLIELEAWLEKVHTAARAGDLDWGYCSLSATLEFKTSQGTQSFRPLEKFIASMDAPHGLPCHAQRKVDTDML
jgi:hypothetical protein